MVTSRETIKLSRATIGCLCLLVGSVVLYLYFLNMSVVQVVMRTEHVQVQNKLRADIAMLESSYIEAEQQIADHIATLNDQDRDAPKIFVPRERGSFVLGNQ